MSDSKIISNTKELKLAQIKLKRIRAERDKIRVDLHSQETAKLKSELLELKMKRMQLEEKVHDVTRSAKMLEKSLELIENSRFPKNA